MRLFIIYSILISSNLLALSAHAEGFYKWVDARGVTQYGDEPPASARAKKMKMPAITVLKDYGKQWETPEITSPRAIPQQPLIRKAAPTAAPRPIQYTTLAFIAPKAGQTINAENGDVSAMLSIKPPLKKEHTLHFIVDGKKVAQGRSRIANFSNLSNGTHSVKIFIVDGGGNILQASKDLSFKVNR